MMRGRSIRLPSIVPWLRKGTMCCCVCVALYRSYGSVQWRTGGCEGRRGGDGQLILFSRWGLLEQFLVSLVKVG